MLSARNSLKAELQRVCPLNQKTLINNPRRKLICLRRRVDPLTLKTFYGGEEETCRTGGEGAYFDADGGAAASSRASGEGHARARCYLRRERPEGTDGCAAR